MKQSFSPPGAPPPVGPYSPVIKCGQMIFVSGQGGFDAQGQLPESVTDQATGALNNLKDVLASAGATLDDVVKATVFLKDMNDFAAVNQIYAQYFQAPFPSRSCVEVARLPKDMLVEIEAIAMVE